MIFKVLYISFIVTTILTAICIYESDWYRRSIFPILFEAVVINLISYAFLIFMGAMFVGIFMGD